MALSIGTKIGVAKETTYGTFVAPVRAFPVNPPTFSDIYTPILDEAIRGRASKDYEIYQGVRHTEASFDGAFYPDEIGYFLISLLGPATSSGASPTTHVITATTTGVPSLSFAVEDDVTKQRFSGMYPTSFGIKFSAAEGLLSYTSSWNGRDAVTTATASVPAFAEAAPWQGWRGLMNTTGTFRVAGASAAGTELAGNLISADITVNRPNEMVYVADGSQLTKRTDPGAIEATWSMVIDFHTTNGALMLDYYRKDAALYIEIDFDNQKAGAARRCLSVCSSKVIMTDAPLVIDRSGITMKMTLTGRSVYNVTSVPMGIDNATTVVTDPISFILINGVASY